MSGPNLLRTSTAGYDEDMNWRRGIGVLWTLFGLIAAAEAGSLAFFLLSGFIGPGLLDIVRLCLLCGVFLALWSGWGWTRWVLAVVAFLVGTIWIVQLFTANDMVLRMGASAGRRLPGESLQNAPVLAAAGLYLILAGYLAFSSDVVGFAKHRREEGRAWVVAPVALLLAVFLACMFFVPVAYRAWLQSLHGGAEAFGHESLQAIAERWDRPALDARCDAKFLEDWTVDQRDATLAYLRPLGPLRDAGKELTSVSSGFDSLQDRFVVRGGFLVPAVFAHGRALVSFDLVRGLLGPWRLKSLSAQNIHVDAPPAPAAATPAASPVPPAGG